MTLFWFRRDLRLEDNTALQLALSSGAPVLPVFIFDTQITEELPKDDPRISFIYEALESIQKKLVVIGSSLLVRKGKPIEEIQKICKEYSITTLCYNRDYEPYARSRDKAVTDFCKQNNIQTRHAKDHVIFEPNEVLKADKTPYTVYTPYKKAWLKRFETSPIEISNSPSDNFLKHSAGLPTLQELDFTESPIHAKKIDMSMVKDYDKNRDIPHLEATSKLGIYLRFGTKSIRKIVRESTDTSKGNEVFLSELIWREFFQQIIFHFPKVVTNNFRSKYDAIEWRNDKEEFKKWCEGNTGYPIVDAGMRELNATGYMHNRVRMITAGFLCKHLLIDWKWGEAYFAKKLMDYELAANNGNWQWAAGTGCDAAPYFRVFNPYTQTKRFDEHLSYIKKWVPEFDSLQYPPPIVEHKFARERALNTYKEGIEKANR
ncbi:MAG: cryptochrome/photolyase family protein [Flavicella sp.]